MAIEQRVMMSEDLVDTISEEVLVQHEHKFLLTILSFEVEDRVESVLGSVHNRIVDESGVEMHVLVGLDDGYAMNITWPNLKLVSYQLKLGLEMCQFDGPFEITKLGLGNIDHDRRNCVIVMKLRKV